MKISNVDCPKGKTISEGIKKYYENSSTVFGAFFDTEVFNLFPVSYRDYLLGMKKSK